MVSVMLLQTFQLNIPALPSARWNLIVERLNKAQLKKAQLKDVTELPQQKHVKDETSKVIG